MWEFLRFYNSRREGKGDSGSSGRIEKQEAIAWNEWWEFPRSYKNSGDENRSSVESYEFPQEFRR
ncbi:hypothetical protein DLM76_13415 [Leptospira yasudae]|nr:hypothetical protein DLM76_13415 [Leptospira yasudae]